MLHENIISIAYIKRKTERLSRTFRVQIDSVVSILSIAKPHIMSITVDKSERLSLGRKLHRQIGLVLRFAEHLGCDFSLEEIDTRSESEITFCD